MSIVIQLTAAVFISNPGNLTLMGLLMTFVCYEYGILSHEYTYLSYEYLPHKLELVFQHQILPSRAIHTHSGSLVPRCPPALES